MAKGKHGGARKGAGRLPKIKELELIERLDNIIESDDAINKLGDLIKQGNFNAIKLYFEYRFGKPKDSLDITSGDEKIEGFNLSNLSEKELSVILKLHAGQSSDTDGERD